MTNQWNLGGSIAKLRTDLNVLSWLLAEEKWNNAQSRRYGIVLPEGFDWSNIHDYVADEEVDPLPE